MDGILRTPTNADKESIGTDNLKVSEWIGDPSSKNSVKSQFDDKLNEEMEKAHKKGLPFCDRAARDDFNDGYKGQAEASLRKNGFVKVEDIKPVKIVWSKYSDLKNFELVEEGEVADEILTKKNPGLNVSVAKKTYQFKGYSNKYVMMEDGPSAIRRARLALKELEK